MKIPPFVCLLSLFSCAFLAANPDPAGLLNQASQIEAKKHDRLKAFDLLEQANAIWEGEGVAPPEYAESLTLQSILLVGHTQNDKQARGVAAVKLSRALSVCRANQPAKPEDLALVLELQSLMMAGKKSQETAEWKEASDIRAKRLLEELAPPDKPGSTAIHLRDADKVDLERPKLTLKTEPEYTEEARMLLISGVVHMSIVIETDGTTSSGQLTHGLGFGLDEKAADAVRRWRFKPASRSGTAFRCPATIEIKFRIL